MLLARATSRLTHGFAHPAGPSSHNSRARRPSSVRLTTSIVSVVSRVIRRRAASAPAMCLRPAIASSSASESVEWVCSHETTETTVTASSSLSCRLVSVGARWSSREHDSQSVRFAVRFRGRLTKSRTCEGRSSPGAGVRACSGFSSSATTDNESTCGVL